MSILVNDQATKFTTSDFPILISSREGFGASRFTIGLLLDLFRQGNKILLFSAFPAAKEDFKKMLTPEESEEVGKRAVLIDSGEQADFVRTIASLEDKGERVVLVKNIERYGQALFDVVAQLPMVILSGDADECPSISWLRQQDFVTEIFFSKPERLSVPDFPTLEKYQGVIFGKRHKGFVKLDQ